MTSATAKQAAERPEPDANSPAPTTQHDEGVTSAAGDIDTANADNAEFSHVLRNARVSLDLKVEKLNYILEMLNELRQLSATIDEPMVAYLIEMAVLETNTAISVQDFNADADRESRAL